MDRAPLFFSFSTFLHDVENIVVVRTVFFEMFHFLTVLFHQSFCVLAVAVPFQECRFIGLVVMIVMARPVRFGQDEMSHRDVAGILHLGNLFRNRPHFRIDFGPIFVHNLRTLRRQPGNFGNDQLTVFFQQRTPFPDASGKTDVVDGAFRPNDVQ